MIKGQIKALQSPAQQENDAELFDFLSEARKKAELLEELHQKFFDVSSPAEKRQLRDEITTLEWALIEATLIEQNKTDALAKLEVYKSSGEKPWFLWKLNFSDVFKQKGGFDIVIGNPPYGLLNKKQNKHYAMRVNLSQLDYYKACKLYSPARGGVINIFRLFLVKSLTLTRKHGVISEIFPLAYTGDVTSANLRREILYHYETLSIDAFPERDDENKRVFRHAKMSVCILLARNRAAPSEFCLRINKDKFVDHLSTKCSMSPKTIQILDESNLTIPVVSQEELQILEKTYKNSSMRVGEFSNCYTGEIDLSLDKKYLRENPNYAVMLKGAIIDRYAVRNKMSQGAVQYLDSALYLSEKEKTGKRATHFHGYRIGMQAITGVNEKIRLKMALPSTTERAAGIVR